MTYRTRVWYGKAPVGENYLTYRGDRGDRRRGDRGKLLKRTVVRWSTYDTHVRYGRQVVKVENYLTYRVQAAERTVRAYGTQMHRMEKSI